jgi:hypothetical protein
MPLFHTVGGGLGVLGAAQRQAVHVPVPAFDPALVPELCQDQQAAIFAESWHGGFQHPACASCQSCQSGPSP